MQSATNPHKCPGLLDLEWAAELTVVCICCLEAASIGNICCPGAAGACWDGSAELAKDMMFKNPLLAGQDMMSGAYSG